MRTIYLLSNVLVSSRNSTDIRSGAVIGRRFDVHTSFGIEIADGVVIGDDCTINTSVGIVHRANGRGEGVARIGNHVLFGMGCKIVGAVTIGDHAIVAANSLVVRDVPPNHLAVGVPARNRPNEAGEPSL